MAGRVPSNRRREWGPDVEKGLNLANDTNEYIELNLFMEIGANNSKIN